MDIRNQKSRYREYIARLTAEIDIDDAQKRASVYDKLRAANEQFFRNNSKALGPEQASLLRDALEEVIHEHETEVTVGQALSRVDFDSEEHTKADPSEPLEIAEANENEPADPRGSAETAGPEKPPGLAGDMPPRQTLPEQVVSTRPTPVVRPKRLGWLLGGTVLGLLVAGAAAWVLVTTGYLGILTDQATIARNSKFETLYAKDAADIDAAVRFLRQVETEIQNRQKTAADALAADFGKAFKQLRELDANLAKKQPKGLPKGTRTIVRADATGYKALLQSPLCLAVSFTAPDMVDPVRAPDGLGCGYFGVWNKAGEAF